MSLLIDLDFWVQFGVSSAMPTENRSPASLEKRRAYTRNYYYRNRASCLERHKRYEAQNRERLKLRSRLWRANHPTYYKERSAKYYAANRLRISQKLKEKRKKDPDWNRFKHRKQLYGVDRAKWDAMLQGQNGVCAICKTCLPATVDHDHLTNEVRGLLCGNCNRGLGAFKDDQSILIAAADYLARRDRCVTA